MIGGTEEHRRECGAERQCVDGRYDNGDGQRDAELTVKDTRRTADKGDGYEYRGHDEGDGNDGAGDLAHGVDGCFGSRFIAAFQFSVYGFHHDHGIIHYDTDSEDEGKEREQVDAEAQEIECEEGAGDGDG